MRSYLGDLEQVVLLAVLRLGGVASDGEDAGSDSAQQAQPDSEGAYGVTIRQEILRCTGRVVSAGTIYPTLDRLERKGYVRSRQGSPSAERGGRSRRLYRLLPDGLAALRASYRMLEALGAGFEPVLSGRAKALRADR